MANENKSGKQLTEQEKQILPMPGEADPKDTKAKVFLAMQKAKRRLSGIKR
jgi:hypothetical protein